MPMVSLKLMAGAARSMVLVASARTTAAKITVRACVLTKRSQVGTHTGHADAARAHGSRTVPVSRAAPAMSFKLTMGMSPF